MKRLSAMLLVTAAAATFLHPAPAGAQAARTDAIWARSTAGQHITLDGVLGEPAWAVAESVIVRYGKENGIPGSGYQEEGGKLAKDSTFAVIKFLTEGNQLFIGFTIRDSSVGGTKDFNRFDGLLMAVKDHLSGSFPAPPSEYFYSWWYPVDSAGAVTPGVLPCFRGRWAPDTCATPRTATQINAWDAATKVHGVSSSDAQPDTGYTIEMKIDLTAMGYNITQSTGDIVEWNVSIYDSDWLWPINLAKFSSNRAWLQGPWGNVMHYDELRIYAKPSVTINSGPPPAIAPDIVVPDAGVLAPPTIDGSLADGIWAHVPSFDIRYDDAALRASYPYVGKWRSGQYQPTVNAHTAFVSDPGDATIKMFTKNDSLYIGFDVRDQVVQYVNNSLDRSDGFIVTLTDRVKRGTDRQLYTWRATFVVGPDGTLLAQDQLPYLRDTLQAVRARLLLKPGTTIDTVGASPDQGYTAEMAVDLTKLGYPHGLGDRTLFVGIDLLDGDSYVPFTDSYGTRTWWYRQYEGECCPPWAFMDPNTRITTSVGEAPPLAYALFDVRPNPAHRNAHLRWSMPAAGDVTVDVYDVLGRRVARHALGVQAAGTRDAALTPEGLHTGVYLYRIRITDPKSGAERATLPGKFMFIK